MTSSRGQNVFVYRHPGNEPWNYPITVFADTGGSLRSVPRNSSVNFGRNTENEKGSSRYFCNNSSGTRVDSENKDSSFIDGRPDPCGPVTNGANSAPILNSIDRELSPVRWCDRKVDGVYLGRSGWVQVQQRSLEDGKSVFCSEYNTLPALSSRKHSAHSQSHRMRYDEKGERSRPLNLPLSLKKRIARGNNEKPPGFFQEFASGSPPSITPIISPPPAFKDGDSNVQFPNRPVMKPFSSEESFINGCEPCSTSSSSSLKERQNLLQTAACGICNGQNASSVPIPKREALYQVTCRTWKAKSLEDDFSNEESRNKCFNSSEALCSFGFHSFDNDIKVGGGGAVRINKNDSSFKNLEYSKGERKTMEFNKEVEEEENDDDNENEDIRLNGHFIESRHTSEEEPSGSYKTMYKVSRPRSPQRNGRRKSYTCRTRSSSLDSSNSMSRSSSSSSSSSYGSGFGGKSSDKLISSRRTNSTENQIFELKNSKTKDAKHFYVKRSKSLQLSENRSSNECDATMNHSSSGKSWNSMPPENLPFGSKSQHEIFTQFPQNSHHILVTANGDSIPVSTSGHQSLQSLNKITTSEEEQKKLILEAEKEARIISEYLSGTRSRAAARNLLLHRYLSRHENEGPADSADDVSPETNWDAQLLNPGRMRPIKPVLSQVEYEKEDSYKKNKPKSTPTTAQRHSASALYRKPFASLFKGSNFPGQTRNAFSPSVEGQGSKERLENKRNSGTSLLSTGSRGSDRSSRSPAVVNVNRGSNVSGSIEKSAFRSSKPKQTPHVKKQSSQVVEGDPRAVIFSSSFKNPLKIFSTVRAAGIGEPNLVESSSTSSSSSDICHSDLATKLNKNARSTDSFEENSKTYSEDIQDFDYRAGSARESDDSISPGADRRSLSLPRSFPSDRYKLNYSQRRDLLLRRRGVTKTTEILTDSQLSRTAPTTPIREIKCDTSPESFSKIQYIGSPKVSPSDELSLSKSLQIPQKEVPEKPSATEVSLNEDRSFFISENSFDIYANPSETVLKKIKKKFPVKYLKTKGYFQNYNAKNSRKCMSERFEDSRGVILVGFSGLSAPETDDRVVEKNLGFHKEESVQKNCLQIGKLDSPGGSSQRSVRGNGEGSEYRDSEHHEDIDGFLVGSSGVSMESTYSAANQGFHSNESGTAALSSRKEVLARRRKALGCQTFCKPDSEIFHHIFTHQLKAKIQWPSKVKSQDYGKGVRRTNSDLGSRKPPHLDFTNQRFVAFRNAPTRGRRAKTVWDMSGSHDSEMLARFMRTQMKRSLSQPSGLNELFPYSRGSPMSRCFVLSEDEKNPRGKTSEDERLTDSESSVTSTRERKTSNEFSSREETAILAEAVWDHVAIESSELPFRAGDVIRVLDAQNWDWWWGATAENTGYFPSAFVRLRVSQEDTVEDCLAAVAKGSGTPNLLRRGKSVSLLSNDQVRSRVVKELLNTERDFVKILRDVKDGYIEQCRRRTDMFTPTQITTIFSNLEEILGFQEKFLEDLEEKVDREFPYKSCIGQAFLTHGSGFRMYSEYCNSHPMAIATLQDLCQRSNYCKFFETCRLKQSLIEIPLDGYLLTPVQRICKYPLQLAELLKYTKFDHADFRDVEEALETMKRVATLINERKRKMESLEKLAAWQQRVEGWEGEDLIDVSSQLIHQGDVVRITSGMWTTNLTLFLFDHQIVYCKKDLLKRNDYIYKGRIYLDASFVIDLPDGKNQQLGVTIKYGLKICSSMKDKWLLFCCRSSQDKVKWLEALAEEKRLVAQDKEGGLDLPPTAKQLAKMAARTKKCPPNKPRCKTKASSNHEDMTFRNCHSDTPKSKSSRRVGTWFTFGGVIKSSKSGPRVPNSFKRVT